MVKLFPTVHRLLELLLALLDENVDDTCAGHIAVLFEVLPDAVTDVRWGHVQRIERDDLRSLHEDGNEERRTERKKWGSSVLQRCRRRGRRRMPLGRASVVIYRGGL